VSKTCSAPRDTEITSSEAVAHVTATHDRLADAWLAFDSGAYHREAGTSADKMARRVLPVVPSPRRHQSDAGNGADLDVLDTVERLSTLSGPVTHQRRRFDTVRAHQQSTSSRELKSCAKPLPPFDD
jgi:hypothetical protein